MIKPRTQPVAKRAGLANDNLLTFCSMLMRKLAREMLTSEREEQLLKFSNVAMAKHAARVMRGKSGIGALQPCDMPMLATDTASLQSGGNSDSSPDAPLTPTGDEAHVLEEHERILTKNELEGADIADTDHLLLQGRMFVAACLADDGVALARLVMAVQRNSTNDGIRRKQSGGASETSMQNAHADRARFMLGKAQDFVETQSRVASIRRQMKSTDSASAAQSSAGGRPSIARAQTSMALMSPSSKVRHMLAVLAPDAQERGATGSGSMDGIIEDIEQVEEEDPADDAPASVAVGSGHVSSGAGASASGGTGAGAGTGARQRLPLRATSCDGPLGRRASAAPPVPPSPGRDFSIRRASERRRRSRFVQIMHRFSAARKKGSNRKRSDEHD